MLWVAATQLILSMVYGQSCMQKLWSAVLSLHVRVYIAIADERGRYFVCSNAGGK